MHYLIIFYERVILRFPKPFLLMRLSVWVLKDLGLVGLLEVCTHVHANTQSHYTKYPFTIHDITMEQDGTTWHTLTQHGTP